MTILKLYKVYLSSYIILLSYGFSFDINNHACYFFTFLWLVAQDRSEQLGCFGPAEDSKAASSWLLELQTQLMAGRKHFFVGEQIAKSLLDFSAFTQKQILIDEALGGFVNITFMFHPITGMFRYCKFDDKYSSSGNSSSGETNHQSVFWLLDSILTTGDLLVKWQFVFGGSSFDQEVTQTFLWGAAVTQRTNLTQRFPTRVMTSLLFETRWWSETFQTGMGCWHVFFLFL